MAVNPDFRELFKTLNDGGVEYLVVGAHAVVFYTVPRYTKDLDVWVNPTAQNAERLWRALASFGAPLEGVGRKDFCDSDLVYQIGLEPNRIDVMMGLSGLEFAQAWPNRCHSTYGGIPIALIGREDLIRVKKAAARPQDLLDVKNLEEG